MLYKDQEDIQFAYERLEEDKKRRREKNHAVQTNDRDVAQPAQTHAPEIRDLESKIAHNVALRFKNQEKFTGKLGEDLTENISNCIDAAQDYKLDQTNKLAFFHNIFDGKAKRFYREKAKGRCGTFEQASQILQDEYNSVTKQNRIRHYLQSLRIRTLMHTERITTAESLE